MVSHQLHFEAGRLIPVFWLQAPTHLGLVCHVMKFPRRLCHIKSVFSAQCKWAGGLDPYRSGLATRRLLVRISASTLNLLVEVSMGFLIPSRKVIGFYFNARNDLLFHQLFDVISEMILTFHTTSLSKPQASKHAMKVAVFPLYCSCR